MGCRGGSELRRDAPMRAIRDPDRGHPSATGDGEGAGETKPRPTTVFPVVPARTGVPSRTLRMLLAALVAAVSAALFGAAQAGAQTAVPNLVETEPANNAELSAPPTEIVLTFDAPIGDSNLITMSCGGDPFTEPNVGRAEVGAAGVTLRLAILTPMPKGDCNVAWNVKPVDGSTGANGRFSFTVLKSPTPSPDDTTPPAGSTAATGESTTTPTAETETPTTGTASTVPNAASVSDGATWLGRVLSTLGLAVLFGALLLIVVAWPEGPEYIVAVRFLRAVWILTFVGTLLYVVALSAAVNGESLGSGLSPASWFDLADAGWAGRAALARLVLVTACAWIVARPERVIDPTTQLPAVVLPTLAVLTIGLSRTGGDLAILGVSMGLVHAVAMAAWLGGVVLLARVVLAGPGEEDLVHAVRGFSRISGPAIVATVVSGLVQLYRLDGGSLFTDGHGRVLLIKAVVVAVMLYVGLTARQIALARLRKAHDLTPPTADRLRRAFGTEALIGIVVIGLSGWLMSFAPAKAPDTSAITYRIVKPFVDPNASQIDLTVSLAPGQVGGNRLRVEVRAPASGITGLVVDFVPPTGSGLQTISQPIPLSGAGVAVLDTNDLPFAVPGAWTMVIGGTTANGPIPAATAGFDVLTADGDVDTPDIEPPPSAAVVTAAPTTTTSTTVPGATAVTTLEG